jgi:predicted alpha/beta hydrolase family esterase
VSGRRFLIVHGVDNRRPVEHWQHWLAEELRRRREVVLYPQLPNPETPSLESWLELIRAELAQLGAGERIVLCHSLGALAWLNLVERLGPGERVHRVLLVSPPSPAILWPAIAQFAVPAGLSPAVVRTASDMTRIVCSDDDPYCPEGAVSRYGVPLELAVDQIPGAGHLSVDDGFGPWPAVLDWCLHETVPLRAAGEGVTSSLTPPSPGCDARS